MNLSNKKIAYFVNQSNWIESIETSESQAELYAEQKDKEGITAYTTNHVDAVFYVLQTYDRVPTVEDVINLHSILLDGIDDRIGLRDGGVSIVARRLNPEFTASLYRDEFDPSIPMHITEVLRECPNHRSLKRMLKTWIKLWEGKPKGWDEGEACLYRHYEFEHIHPFFDGNGRTGRLLYLWDQLYRGFSEEEIDVITFQDRRDYYKDIECYIDKERKKIKKEWLNEIE